MTGQTVRRFGTTTWNESYTYTDGLNRLNAASESGNWTQTYVFDRFGNRAVTSNSYIPPGGEATTAWRSFGFFAFR